jgi:hypothetical protein
MSDGPAVRHFFRNVVVVKGVRILTGRLRAAPCSSWVDPHARQSQALVVVILTTPSLHTGIRQYLSFRNENHPRSSNRHDHQASSHRIRQGLSFPATRIIREAQTGLIKFHKTITENSQLPPLSLSLSLSVSAEKEVRDQEQEEKLSEFTTWILCISNYSTSGRSVDLLYSSAAPGIWFIAEDFDSCKHVSLERLTLIQNSAGPKKQKNKTKKQNKTKPTKNCSLLIDCFPAAKEPQSKKVINDGDSVSPLHKGRSCTSGSTRPDQGRPAASSPCSLHHFSSKTISTRCQIKKQKNRPSRNFFKDARRSIGRFKIK